MERIKDFTETFYLENNEDRAKLLEVLLVVGALIFAFNKLDISNSINICFLLFMFISVAYFIIILKDKNEMMNEFIISNINNLNILVATMSFSFSMTLSYSLHILLKNLISDNKFISKIDMLSYIPTILSILYALIFGLIIYSALRFKPENH